MIQLHIVSRQNLLDITSIREGETKMGQALECIESLDELETSSCTYVIFGIEEDIGVQANYGKKGARKAWMAFLSAFVNMQSNSHSNGSDVLILGAVSVSAQLEENTPEDKLGDVVNRIDKKVAFLVKSIIEAGKIPILIGGGHNNAFGALSGTSQALKKSINCINLDAHSDLRSKDYRHSGNGFTYALESKETRYLKKYAIFGAHKNYTPDYILQYITEKNKDIKIYFFEEMLMQSTALKYLNDALDFMGGEAFGLELDCDVIKNFPASAKTPSGFTLEEIRFFIGKIATNSNVQYLHICEASPTKDSSSLVGKSLSYLVTDFIMTHRENNLL